MTEEDNINYDELLEVIENAVVSYDIQDDGSVNEHVKFEDNDGNVSTNIKTVYPNGDYKLITNTQSSDPEIITGSNADYTVFLKLANNGEIVRGNHGDGLSRGSDITGSQYKHVYIGQSAEETFYSDEINAEISVASAALKIYSRIPGVPYGLAVGFGSILLDLIVKLDTSPYKTVIQSTTYEVHFSSGGYYIHCYHTVAKLYDSSNKLLNTVTDYYQAIGG